MRILYLSLDPRQPLDARTGGVTHIREMVRALEEEGHAVHLHAPATGLASGASSGGPSLRTRIKRFVPRGLWLLARDLADTRRDRRERGRIEQAVQSFQPDVIYERNAYLFGSGARVALAAGLPYFLEVNAPTAMERRENFGAPLAWWHQRIESFQHRVASGIVVVSEPLRTYLVEAGVDADKVIVVPNGVRLEDFTGSSAEGSELKQQLGLTGPVIGFVGSIASYHGLDRLLEAMPQVRQALPDATALIVGGGPLLEPVQEAASRVAPGAARFVGEVGAAEVARHVSAFDVAVLPRTAKYCSPIKLFEYGAVGVPVIAARTETVAAILGDGANGVMLGEGESLATAITELLSDPERARAMGESFRQRVRDHLTWRHAARRVVSFIEARLA